MKKNKNKSKQKNILVVIIIIITIILVGVFVNRKMANEGKLNVELDETNTLASLEINETIAPEENTIILEEENTIILEEENTIIAKEEENTNKENQVQKSEINSTNNNVSSSSPYYIKVNTKANCVTIYTKDGNGNYTVPAKSMICSTGPYTPPCGKYPKSVYKIPGTKWTWGYLQGNVWGHYVTKITGNILFHSVPYTAKRENSLEYWEFDKLGTSASAGCIRLQIKDSKWIYDNVPGGTYIEFYQDSNPGPLGKPGAPKISSNTTCRDWDPTDPSGNNLWKTYNQNNSTSVKEETNKNQNKDENKSEDKKENKNSNTLDNKDNNEKNTTNTNNSKTNNMKDLKENTTNTKDFKQNTTNAINQKEDNKEE